MKQFGQRSGKAIYQHRTRTGTKEAVTINLTGTLLTELGEGFGFWIKGKFLTTNQYRDSPYAQAAYGDNYSDSRPTK